MGKIMMPRKGKIHTAPSLIKPDFSDNTWGAIASACKTNSVPATWFVGNQKPMAIKGTPYMVDIIGKDHDEYSDGSGKAPLTFQLHECVLETGKMNDTNTNVGGYRSSAMNTVFLPSWLAEMPEAVRNNIREVNKLTSIGNLLPNVQNVATKLFLLSEMEVFGYARWSKPGEGTQYEWYKAGGSTIKTLNGNGNYWWLRSPYKDGAAEFCFITNGGSENFNSASFSYGVSFAFCF